MKFFRFSFLIPFILANMASAQSSASLCDDGFWTSASRVEITKAIATQDVSGICEFGLFPLHKAAKLGTAADIAALVARGAYVNQASMNFGSPLHVAVAYGGTVAHIEALLKSGADLELKDQSGFTPLDEAFDLFRPEIAAALRAAGAVESGR